MRQHSQRIAAQLEAIAAAPRVRRYHTLGDSVRQSVGEHTHGVALLVCVLTEFAPGERLLTAALLHDVAEYVTGDVPSPVKRQLDGAIDELENDVLRRAHLPVLDLSESEARILKLADLLEGAMYCGAELRRGNADLAGCFLRYVRYIEELAPAGTAFYILQHLKEKYHGLAEQATSGRDSLPS